jgi:hypothetical protein
MRREKGAPRLDVLTLHASPETKCPTRTPGRPGGKVSLRVECAAGLEEDDVEPALRQLLGRPTSGGAGPDHDGVMDSVSFHDA